MGRRRFSDSSMDITTLNVIGQRIYKQRATLALTQDEFASRYGISGPAIFKFERGYVIPSLDLWLVMAKDFKVPEKQAVFLWIQSRLPKKYQKVIDIRRGVAPEKAADQKGKKKKIDYRSYSNRNKMRETALKDSKLPKGLKDFIKDDALWNLYSPDGSEIAFLRDTFGSLGKGSKASFREALRLLRAFTGEE